MTLIEKFYDWYNNADFDEILMTLTMFTLVALLVAFLAAMLIGLTIGVIQ